MLGIFTFWSILSDDFSAGNLGFSACKGDLYVFNRDCKMLSEATFRVVDRLD